jgi:hypothetical protein
MTWRILSVLPNPGTMEQVKDALDKELRDISFDFTSNEAKAKEKLKTEKYHLIVASLDIPEDSKADPMEGLRRGLDLAQWMQSEKMNIPTILFKIVDDPELERTVNKMDMCELIHEKPGWEDEFIKRVRQGLSPFKLPDQKRPDDQKRLDVDIHLDLDKKTADYSFKGVGNAEYRPLNIPTKEFLDLTTESRALERPTWQCKLQYLGEKLMKHIFQSNFDFAWDFKELVQEAGGLNNTRIRFVVEKEVYPIALEAIYGPCEQLEKDYWMLHAPIYRTVVVDRRCEPPLFHDQETRVGPLNILIIESPTEGEVHIKRKGSEGAGWPHRLERLTNVIDECDSLKNYCTSREYPGRVKIGKIEVIPRLNDMTPFAGQVQEALERKWHIVHYAGHSYFDPDTNEGYVFFPKGKDDKEKTLIEVVDLDHLSAWLRRANPNLVFLSSCRSSEEGFVFALARKGIPATVGFRWDVEDEMAAGFSKVFYRSLFSGETQSLEYVFLKARQDIYKQYPDNPIWAAPVLVMQIPSR